MKDIRGLKPIENLPWSAQLPQEPSEITSDQSTAATPHDTTTSQGVPSKAPRPLCVVRVTKGGQAEIAFAAGAEAFTRRTDDLDILQ